MRGSALLVACTLCAIAACGQPTLVECPLDQTACATGCVDTQADPANCGTCDHACGGGETCVQGGCSGGSQDACPGGCGSDATCLINPATGAGQCACNPGFVGDGQACTACIACGSGQYMVSPCTPAMNTVCADCTTCADGTLEIAACTPTQDTACEPCDPSCATCSGAPDSCTSCAPGLVLAGTTCVPGLTSCGNGLIDAGEQCDDGNPVGGDGCSATCAVEAGFYCFGEGPSFCRVGTCATELATTLPLGPAFTLDGAGTTGPSGLTFSQRSTIYTAAEQAYPLMIEADVTYSTEDTTFIGARGSGVREAASSDEPETSVRGRISPSEAELAAGSAVLSSMPTVVPTPGIAYHVRYVDDGFLARVDWIDPVIPGGSFQLLVPTNFHGTDDHAFLGGGDMAGLTVTNIRVCSAPVLPVTGGLAARYTAHESWTVTQDMGGNVSGWLDVSGNGNDLVVATSQQPVYVPGLVQGLPALDFTGGARLTTAPFPLTTDVTVFAVIEHRVPDAFGAIAHHGDRDLDWSMEQNGTSASSNDLHWQTNADNTNMDLTLVPLTNYVLTGRFDGNARYFSASTFDAAPPTETSIVDASHTITAGDKQLNVGTSDAGDASNAYIADIVYFARALTDTERDEVIAYLRQLWLQ